MLHWHWRGAWTGVLPEGVLPEGALLDRVLLDRVLLDRVLLDRVLDRTRLGVNAAVVALVAVNEPSPVSRRFRYNNSFTKI